MKSTKLFNVKMADGTRHFADLPETVSFDKLREVLQSFTGAKEIHFLTNQVTEVWLDFEYRENRFSINNQHGDYCFFVDDPKREDEILLEVIEYFGRFLGK